MTPGELEAIERQARAVSGVGWKVIPNPEPDPDADPEADGELVVGVTFADGHVEPLEPRLDWFTPGRHWVGAGREDVTFIAHARDDVLRLVAHLRGTCLLTPADIEAISARCAAASPGPWEPFLESDGGNGGRSVIRTGLSDEDPDLYLFLGGRFAPDPDFEFVATVRQDIPVLLRAATG